MSPGQACNDSCRESTVGLHPLRAWEGVIGIVSLITKIADGIHGIDPSLPRGSKQGIPAMDGHGNSRKAVCRRNVNQRL